MSRYLHRGLFIAIAASATVLFFVGGDASSLSAPAGEFGGVSLRIEYATTSVARARGLGGRESVAPDEAMLFVFPRDERCGFWMKDTLVPLDIFWLDNKGQVVSIAQDVATSTYPNVFYPAVPARYVLETAAGFAREHSIATGTPLRLKNFERVTE